MLPFSFELSRKGGVSQIKRPGVNENELIRDVSVQISPNSRVSSQEEKGDGFNPSRSQKDDVVTSSIETSKKIPRRSRSKKHDDEANKEQPKKNS